MTKELVEEVGVAAQNAWNTCLSLPPIDLTPEEQSHIARSLLPILARQRNEGIEAAAGVAYLTCAETRHVTLGDKCATAIRALKEPE